MNQPTYRTLTIKEFKNYHASNNYIKKDYQNFNLQIFYDVKSMSFLKLIANP